MKALIAILLLLSLALGGGLLYRHLNAEKESEHAGKTIDQLTTKVTETEKKLASERLAVGLDSGAQEDEQSCFSDTTHQDFVFALEGIRIAWYGRDGKGLASVLRPLRPALADDLDARFAKAEAAIAAMPRPFDRMLASAPDSAERAAGEAAVTALQELGAGLRDAGNALGVLVIVSGV